MTWAPFCSACLLQWGEAGRQAVEGRGGVAEQLIIKFSKLSPSLGFWPLTGMPVEVRPLPGSEHATPSSPPQGLPHTNKLYPSLRLNT